MNGGYAFSFDARFCSGCKACQAACKDKNNLPPGVLWRRVIEVSGGDWRQQGTAWNNTVFAYNLSISCNHCKHPKCAGICPTNAYAIYENGIVFLDTTKCMGCGYCAWACPYDAPQYNPDIGCMTKCDFCVDQLEQGMPPTCVAACPMRVLDYGDETTVKGIWLWEVPSETHPYPLPGYSHTQPRLAIQPHMAMTTTEKKSVANQEEIQPRRPSSWEDVPLVLFTLLAQMAVGSFWALFWMSHSFLSNAPTRVSLLPNLLIGACLGAGMLASFAHLGVKTNAWRALANWRRSSLSREVLFAGLFGLGWLATTLEIVVWKKNSFELSAITAILGFGLIHNMSQVYRFPAAPGWNSWRTNAGFTLSAILLGHAVMAPLLAYEASLAGLSISPELWMSICTGLAILLLVQLVLSRKQTTRSIVHTTRVGLILVGTVLSAVSGFQSSLGVSGLSVCVFLIVLLEETLGRWSFYRSRV